MPSAYWAHGLTASTIWNELNALSFTLHISSAEIVCNPFPAVRFQSLAALPEEDDRLTYSSPSQNKNTDLETRENWKYQKAPLCLSILSTSSLCLDQHYVKKFPFPTHIAFSKRGTVGSLLPAFLSLVWSYTYWKNKNKIKKNIPLLNLIPPLSSLSFLCVSLHASQALVFFKTLCWYLITLFFFFFSSFFILFFFSFSVCLKLQPPKENLEKTSFL